MTLLDRVVTRSISMFISLGVVWFWAMLFNPNIDSGTVTLLGLIFGALTADIEALHYNR